MKPPEPKPPSKSEEFERFEGFLKELISVPKTEIDKRAEEYERQKQSRKGRKAAKK